MDNRLELYRKDIPNMVYLSWDFELLDGEYCVTCEFDEIDDIKHDISAIKHEWQLLSAVVNDIKISYNDIEFSVDNIIDITNQCKEITVDFKTHLSILEESIDDKWNWDNINNSDLLMQKYNDKLDKLCSSRVKSANSVL